VRVGVIETPFSDWQPDVLPLNYTRLRYAAAYLRRGETRQKVRGGDLCLIIITSRLTTTRTSVLPPGFEPGTAASKADMISISPQELK
jgi:hypothetical protein